MAWVTQHIFANAERVRVPWLKSLYGNMLELHDPQEVFTRSLDTSGSVTTTSATFVAVDATYLRAKITITSSRNLLVVANVGSFASAGDTEGQIDLYLDGVSVSSSTNGLYIINWHDQMNSTPLVWYLNEVTAGQHELILMHRRTQGAGNIQTYWFNKHWFRVIEL